MTTSMTMTQTAGLNNEQMNILCSTLYQDPFGGEYPELRLTRELNE